MIYLVSEGSTYVEPVSNFVGAQQTSNPFMECFLVLTGAVEKKEVYSM